MDYSTGKLAFIFLAAALLSVVAALLLAWRYRRSMRALMSAPAMPGAAAMPAPLLAATAAAPLSAADNRRAGWRVMVILVLLSALLSFSEAWLFLSVAMAAEAVYTPNRLLVLGIVNLWPVIPVLGVLWRWSRLRVVGVLLLWFAACFVLLLWRSTAAQSAAGLLLYLASEIGPPMLLVGALCLGGATRAISPWLLPPLVALVWASIAGVDVLGLAVERRHPWLMSAPGWLRAEGVMAFFIVAPWLLAWWPAKQLARALAAAYARKWLSELMVLFTAVWGITLLMRALGAASDLGLGGLVMLLPLAWIPLVMVAAKELPGPVGRPPTLLVLRVFQRDAQVQALFDDVVERTIDASDIFDFIDGRLAERFIRHPSEVAARVAAFDLERDAEGRYRVNECYCHDSTWREALAALVARSDVVLMDLRRFKTRNEGCRHELGVLARAARLARVVVLTDGDTDRAAAEAATAGAPAGRFSWIDSSRVDAAKRREVLAALFVAGSSPHQIPR